MKIIAAIKKVPWFRLLRYLPGIIGATGELLHGDREKEHTDALRQIRGRYDEIARSIAELESRIKLVFWIAVAALVSAVAALIAALVK